MPDSSIDQMLTRNFFNYGEFPELAGGHGPLTIEDYKV
jgi:hypothetical protein